MDSFLSKYVKGPVKVLGYADGILCYVGGMDETTMAELFQVAVDEVVQWDAANGLSFNPKKTKMVLFSKKRKVIPPNIKLQGDSLELSDSLKYLGVDIHKKLLWNKHINKRFNK